jgi:hypothetical protein
MGELLNDLYAEAFSITRFVWALSEGPLERRI